MFTTNFTRIKLDGSYSFSYKFLAIIFAIILLIFAVEVYAENNTLDLEELEEFNEEEVLDESIQEESEEEQPLEEQQLEESPDEQFIKKDDTDKIVPEELGFIIISIDAENESIVTEIGEINVTVITVNYTELEELNRTVNITNDQNETLDELNVTDSLKQFYAEINKPVEWGKEIILMEKASDFIVEVPVKSYDISIITTEDGAEIPVRFRAAEGYEALDSAELKEQDYLTLVIEDLVGNVKIKYFTPGPIASEEVINGREGIIISSDISYEEVFSYMEIAPTSKRPKLIHLNYGETIDSVGERKDVTNDLRYNARFEDKDNDGKYDYVSWITPHLSNQTFIIEIIGAEHLDENRTFISDIYDEVKDLDGNWSEVIPNTHYVRVVFEKNLTSEKDITVFPMIVNGTPRIEVYEFKGREVIAEFTSIISNEYNKVFLTELQGEQDTFDLRIIGGSLQFDHIIDPVPDLTSVILNSTFGTNLTTENLTVYTDQDDNSSLKLIYDWKKDSNSIAVLNMPFEGGSNSTFTKDYSSYGNNGMVNGSTYNSTGGYEGKGAYKFNRENHTSIIVPDFTYGDNFTISFWFNTPSLSGSLWHYMYSHGVWNAVNNVRIYFAESNGNLFTQIRDSNDQDITTLTLQGFDDSNWHFYTLTVEKTAGVKLYIDGVLNKSNSSQATDSFNPGTDLYIGARSDLNSGRHYNGFIDELGVYNHSLSAEQISALYNNRTDLIVSQETGSGETWSVEATPNDGTEDGNSVLSNNLTILGPSSGSVSVRVSQSSDDAEEAVTGPFTGDVEIDSSDLEMVEDLGFQEGNQTIGLRFQNLEIPNGAVIGNAYIEFEVDETNSVSTNLRIYGEDIDNAPTFTTTSSSITARTKTSAFASWDNIPAWNNISEKQQTVDISNVVKEIVDRPGWSSGNSMIFIINGTGKRVAEAWDGESANAPLLVINWSLNNPPTIDSIALNSTFGTNLTGENLTVYVTTSDADGDSVKVIYDWKKGGSSIALMNMPFEGGSTSTFTKDYSGFSRNASGSSSDWLKTGGYDGFGAYEFDGATNNPLTVTHHDSLNLNGNFSISFWLYLDSQGGSFPSIMHKGVGTSSSNGWNLFTQGNTIFYKRNNIQSLAANVTTNQWDYFVITFNDDTDDARFYRNAILFDNETIDYTDNTGTDDILIGRSRDLGAMLDGKLDEIMIFNRTLSPQQISALYNNRTDLIVSQETSNGDVWSVDATPNDGIQDGATSQSNSVTIVEAACSLGILLSDIFSNAVHWDVDGLPATELDSDGNNAGGDTEYNVSITATGCTADLEIRANSDLTSGVNTIPLANEKYAYNRTDVTVPSGTKMSLTTTFSDVDTNLVTQVTFFKFFLNVSGGQPIGTYNNTIEVRVTQS